MLTWKVKCQLLGASGAFHTDHVFIVQAISPSEAKAAAWKLLKQELPGDYAGWQVIMTTEIVLEG